MQATVIVSVALLDNGRVLLVQEGKEFCRGLWSLPGGRVEQGESILDAVVREAREETGYEVRITAMTRVLRYTGQGGFHCVRFNFVGEIVGGEEMVDGGEILDIRWIDLDGVTDSPELPIRTPWIVRRITDDLRAGTVYPIEIFYDGFAPEG
jgi:8-oxo-dGTP diphosphatase